MPKSIVLYTGPSVLDGAPIVAIATLGSSNEKTGPMVQTWIVRADMEPTDASRQGADESVCGTCPRRHALGGDCYVLLQHAPLGVFRKWRRDGEPGPNWDAPENLIPLATAARVHGLRLGSYGDPAAVPHTVWADLMRALEPRVHTGYTHQWWRLEAGDLFRVSDEHIAWCRANLMASADSYEQARRARMLDWRFFLAAAPGAPRPERTIECLADRADNPRSCEECGICNGARAGRDQQPVSVYIVEHGARSKAKHRRSDALRVVA